MTEKRLLPMRRVEPLERRVFEMVFLKDFIHAARVILLLVDCDKYMQVIWHNHVPADPRAVRRTFLSKTQKSFVNWGTGKNLSPIFRARRDEVDRRAHEQELETMQALLSIFGGHRPPLQF
jgi:hypothetical protein